jgi:hypothetical protein
MGTVAAGARLKLSQRVFLRAEVRDYVTAFPKEIITPAPGARYGTLLHDLTPMVGIWLRDVSPHSLGSLTLFWPWR